MHKDKARFPLPTLWLLGKTGAGKSSLIRFLTGNEEITIGNGFRPCTETSQSYDFPDHDPWIRFLDTRGLSEVDYDPEEDLVYCQQQSHALLLCVRLDDPEQSVLLRSLKKIKSTIPAESVLVIHTAMGSLSDNHEIERAHQSQQSRIEKAWGGTLAHIRMELADADNPIGGEILQQKLTHLLPSAAYLSEQLRMREEELNLFKQYKPLIKRFATGAAASDTLPLVGLVTVPSLQGAMIHQLAKAYQLDWSQKDISAFIATLGTGFGIQYASHLGLRQLIKLLPVYGQTLGSAGAAAVSFATTYAIGRVTCLYLYYQLKKRPLSAKELERYYRNAFTSARLEKRNEETV